MANFGSLHRSGDDFEDRRGKAPKGERGKKEGLPWRSPGRSLFFWLVIVLSVLLIYNFFGEGTNDTATITYTDFLRYVSEGKISSVLFVERNLSGRFTEEMTIAGPTGSGKYKKFQFRIPFDDPTLVEKLTAAGISINAKEQGINWGGVLLTVAPWLLLIFVWMFMLRQMQGGAGGSKGIFSFGKSRAKLLTDERPRVTFADVAGADEAKQELSEVIDFLKDPGKFQKLGGKIPKGALLLGAPGTGKTLLARAVAGEAGVPFFSMSGSDFVEMFVGVGASRVRDLFDQGKKHAPCIIFIDEIDAVGRHRGAGLGGGHDEREQTLNQLLVEMDGFESNDGVILLAATNRPDVLDPALLRPGRFDRQIVVDVPDVRGREGILKVHTKKVKLAEDVDLTVLARGTPGLSGADIANLVNEAALLAARKDKSAVDMADFEEAKDKVMMGAERKSMVISDREKKMTAYHESGHALLGKLVPKADPVHKVTIVPRGLALGVTHYLPVDERHTYDREYLEGHLICMMGGRVAEKLVYNYVTTGAGKDIEQATELARKMVCNWGMSEKIGPLGFGRRQEQIFLGREIQQPRDYSEATAQLIDAEIRRFVEEAEAKAMELLRTNRDKLEKLAEALLEKEILDGSEIDRIIGIEPQQPEPAPETAPLPD
ncbi:MAG: ATP-dependent metallopeptidase FtsH/Yme1/Tma family protein [candidate division Zixibacteria bacterium]|nr:ATP-dependent metallopeptidase FtsH/Yme1/Tma family protein [candidate division Zixibacteria bacterium]